MPPSLFAIEAIVVKSSTIKVLLISGFWKPNFNFVQYGDSQTSGFKNIFLKPNFRF